MTDRNKTFGAKGWTPEQLGSLAGKTYVITGGPEQGNGDKLWTLSEEKTSLSWSL